MSFTTIRQVIIGTGDMESASAELRSAFGLAAGFADPLLEDIGMDDQTFRVGPQAHLELVGPLTPEAPINGWIAKAGGVGGGYGLAIQVDDLGPLLAAADALGIRRAHDLEAYGHRIVQLHPGDLGLLVELDEIADPDAWFWDDVDAEVPDAPVVDDVLAVEISSPDPQAQSAKWATLFGLEVSVVDDVPQLQLGSRTVRFVQGDAKMMTGVDLAVVAGREPAERTVTISGVTFTLV
ncbi:VOC family protein [Aeromicrobium wangtongii]|uniref:VOC domain-containing protein n=1 Tax=Aeromicrobium wangtongii TaxID=2969247 RepID=A0ABY5M5P8_9ACTN|nr:hypothetical protein [Aeromicrobium wangtongii]MCD9199875.1 hypothetical protein [Aeromicrobium wangtongii]UUP13493.1 hypothetical protein NQV15_16835 [Aeromicrobium wangtongii]